MPRPVFICDPCDEVTPVCEHLDMRIQYLEHIQFTLERWVAAGVFEADIRQKVQGLLQCDHPTGMNTADYGSSESFCMVCRDKVV